MHLTLDERVYQHLSKGMVPYILYNIVVQNEIVGKLIYREGTDEQCYYDGHIGYSIYEEYRGHSYAYKACLLLKDMIDNEYVYITCSPYNIASKKTIEKLNAEFIEKTLIPDYLKKFYSEDDYEKLIYRWKVKE